MSLFSNVLQNNNVNDWEKEHYLCIISWWITKLTQCTSTYPSPTNETAWDNFFSTSLPLTHQTNFMGDLDPPIPGHYYFYTVGKTNTLSDSVISAGGHSRDANAGISSCYTTLDHWIILFQNIHWLSHHGLSFEPLYQDLKTWYA